jgi:excisionase family DNA binding protein
MSGDSVFKTCWEHAGGDPELALWFAIVAKRYEMDLDVLDGQRRCLCPLQPAYSARLSSRQALFLDRMSAARLSRTKSCLSVTATRVPVCTVRVMQLGAHDNALVGVHLTVKQAANYARVSPNTIRKWISDGDLPAAKAGCAINSKVVVKRSDLDEFLWSVPAA